MIRTTDRDGVRVLALDRPPVNALDPELLRALASAVERAPSEGARALVLAGREGCFSAGLDVKHFLALDREGARDGWRTFLHAAEALGDSAVPVVAAITGHAPAGGCVLALHCDRRVMADGKFVIGMNEVRIGVPLPPCLLTCLERAVGTREAERLGTEGRMLPPDEAVRIGLVDELVAPERAVERAVELARAFTELPPVTLERTRRAARAPLAEAFDALDDAFWEGFLDHWESDECRAALAAALNKR